MKKFSIRLFLFGNLAATLFLWWSNSGSLFTSGESAGIYLGLGRLSGLLLVLFILMQFFIMSRAPFLEQTFGLDKLARWHHFIGKYLLIFLLGHPLFLTLAYADFNNTSYLQQYIGFLKYTYVPWAVLAHWLLIFVIIYSILMVWRKWNFEKWYAAHLMVYAAVLLAFRHQIALGGDLSGGWPRSYWLGLYVFVAMCVLLYRISKPMWLFYKHRFFVSGVVAETKDVTCVYVAGQKMEEFRFRSGQFVIVRFLDKQRKWQAHPFSLSQLFNGKEIRLSIKASGDFTSQISNLKPQTALIIEGPYGVFTADKLKGNKALLIAGGIGITPVRGIMEELGKRGKDVVLLYANKMEEDIALRSEIESIANEYGFALHHFISKAEKPTGIGIKNFTMSQEKYSLREGFIDLEAIKKLVPDIHEREVFLCGPPPMMAALQKILVEFGVPKNNIYFEKFSL